DIGFVIDETHYVLGRFKPNKLGDYLSAQRTGRGNAPAMDRTMRGRLLNDVIDPYVAWKANKKLKDFHDLAIAMADAEPVQKYDVVVVDEAQDMSANQLRAIMRHRAELSTVTIVTDTAQRIYPRGTTWIEAD